MSKAADRSSNKRTTQENIRSVQLTLQTSLLLSTMFTYSLHLLKSHNNAKWPIILPEMPRSLSVLCTKTWYKSIADICKLGWSYFGGYCYITSQACATWLTAVSNCSTMDSSLVTVHNQKENVYIQHRHNGDKSWIGLNDRSVEGSFVWTNKELSSFRFWARNQPNNCVHKWRLCAHSWFLGWIYLERCTVR